MSNNKQLLTRIDWSQTSLGPRALWPVSMNAVITAIMDSEFPICTAWGDEYIQIYNEAYNAIYGDKHPTCFGRAARESWPEIWPFLEPALNQVCTSREAMWFENTMLALVKHVDPEECWFDFCYSPLSDERGHVLGVMSVATDKTAEVVSRRRSESLALSVPDTVSDPLFALANSLKAVLSGNEMDICVGALYGADPHTGAATDVLWTIRVEPCDRQALRDILPYNLQLKKQVQRFELPNSGLGQESCAKQGVLMALLDQHGRPAGWLQLVPHRLVPHASHLDFVRSLAERASRVFGVLQSHAHEVDEVRAELTSNEQLYRFLFDNIDDAAFYTINSGAAQEVEIIAAANHKAIELLGYPLSDLVGMRREHLFFPDDASLIEAVRTRSRDKLFVGEMTCRRQDGSPLLVEISSRLIELPNSQTRSVSLMRDISKRKRMEQERIEQARYEAMSLLTGGIAHDFNNLLTVILNSIELIEMNVAKDAGIGPFIENAIKSAHRGATLTNQLLAYSRRQIQQRRTIQINDVVVESRELLESLLGSHELVLDLATELPLCAFDPTQLTTIILNLAANARDAMDGIGRFTLTTLYDVEKGFVVLTARDTGSGISHDIVHRIFDPYFTTKAIGHGTGLGLAMVKGLMNQAAGDVTVNSVQGQGASFTLRFPAVQDSPLAPSDRTVATIHISTSIHALKVLLVDDNELILKQTANILSEEGAHVSVAGSAREALRIIAQTPDLDLIISDVVMPGGITGSQLMYEVHSTAPNVARLLMSGFVPEEMGHPPQASDEIALLRKPFTRSALMAAVRKALETARH